MLPATKIYIDSRQSVSDVQNSASFSVELDRSYKMPHDTVFFITDCCIPHSWMTVETGVVIQYILWLVIAQVLPIAIILEQYHQAYMTVLDLC